MKYKVGDKVKIVGNTHSHCFAIGAIVEINTVYENEYRCYGLDTHGNLDFWLVNECDISAISSKDEVKKDYTWEDFLKAPIGTKVTFESGEILIKSDSNEFSNEHRCRGYTAFNNFESTLDGKIVKIIKIEEPTYTTVYEPKEVTMPEIDEMKRLTDELCKTCDEFIKKIKEK